MSYYLPIYFVWSVMFPKDEVYPKEAGDIASAISMAVESEEKPVLHSKVEDAVAEAVFAVAESRLQSNPTPMSPDAKSGTSCGVWQEPCYLVRKLDLVGQAKLWLDILRWSVKVCPASHFAALCGGSAGCVPGTEAWMISGQRLQTIKDILNKLTKDDACPSIPMSL